MAAGHAGAGEQREGSSSVVRPLNGLEIAGNGLLARVLPWGWFSGRAEAMVSMHVPRSIFAMTYLRHAFAMSLKRLG